MQGRKEVDIFYSSVKTTATDHRVLNAGMFVCYGHPSKKHILTHSLAYSMKQNPT